MFAVGNTDTDMLFTASITENLYSIKRMGYHSLVIAIDFQRETVVVYRYDVPFEQRFIDKQGVHWLTLLTSWYTKVNIETWWRHQIVGNIFCVTGPLWGEFIGHRWIPLS